jgi:hypothetical protein
VKKSSPTISENKDRLYHEGNEGVEGVEMKNEKFNPLCRNVLAVAIEVHRNLGPGLLESTYQQCLSYDWVKEYFT